MSTSKPAAISQETVNALVTGWTKMNAKDREFAGSLVNQLNKYGKLSEKQWHWFGVMASRLTTPEVKPEMKQTVVGQFDGLKALFDKAKSNGLKSPSIVLNVPEVGAVRLNVATFKAQKPGSINVVSEVNGAWYGRIDGATYEASNKRETPAALTAFLKSMSRDPVGFATAQGRLNAKCIFCNGALSDPRSAAVGYGQTCAKNWGLPYPTLKEALASIEALKASVPALAPVAETEYDIEEEGLKADKYDAGIVPEQSEQVRIILKLPVEG